MKKNREGFFWLSFSDLMTSLFFIMFVLFITTYLNRNKYVEHLEDKLKVFELVDQNLKPLKQDSGLFRYEEKYKRFTLAFDVNFKVGKFQIIEKDLKDFFITSKKIKSVGRRLQLAVNVLAENKIRDSLMKNVSYLLIISGYASHLSSEDVLSDYDLSYKRAYNLWLYWKSIGIDFEAKKYDGLIDLQIAGNGWGGVGRFERDPENFMREEMKNQRFIIQIVPKVGNTNIN